MEIHLISPENIEMMELVEKVRQVHPQIDYIHIRQKKWSEKQVEACVDLLLAQDIPKEKIVINTFVSVAIRKQIPTIHLPISGPPVKVVRQQYPMLRIGASVHSLEAAKTKMREGADYLFFGHVFPTASKLNKPAQGVEVLQTITKQISLPIIAIGGITPEKVKLLYKAGAAGIALLSYVLQNKQTEQAAKQIRKEVKGIEINN